MNRRHFIRNSIIATGALSIAQNAIYDTFAAAYKDEIDDTAVLRRSIMLGLANVGATMDERCRAIRKAGFDGVEPGSHLDRKSFLDAAQSAGLAIASVCNSKHWDFPLSHPDPIVRQKGMDAMKTALEDAAFYETDAVLLVPGVVNKSVSYDDCWKRSQDCISQLVPFAASLKVKICIENVWNNFLLSPLEAAQYVDQFESQYVGFYFDCGNILNYGFPEQWLKILGNRVKRIHIKEFSTKKADKEGRWAGFDVKLTEGDVPWADIMTEVRQNYKGEWLTLEQSECKTEEQLTDLRERLDRIIAV